MNSMRVRVTIRKKEKRVTTFTSHNRTMVNDVYMKLSYLQLTNPSEAGFHLDVLHSLNTHPNTRSQPEGCARLIMKAVLTFPKASSPLSMLFRPIAAVIMRIAARLPFVIAYPTKL